VHEAYLRLCGGEGVTFRGKNHFFAAAALAMRHVLVDRARRQQRQKRGGGERPLELLTDPAMKDGGLVDLIDLDTALSRLEQTHARAAQVVTLRYFAGLSNQEIAAVLEVGDATVERDWKFAKAWLHRALAGGGDG
jgi:RNA polymerase sigma factor (TIGR02999 family)